MVLLRALYTGGEPWKIIPTELLVAPEKKVVLGVQTELTVKELLSAAEAAAEAQLSLRQGLASTGPLSLTAAAENAVENNESLDLDEGHGRLDKALVHARTDAVLAGRDKLVLTPRAAHAAGEATSALSFGARLQARLERRLASTGPSSPSDRGGGRVGANVAI